MNKDIDNLKKLRDIYKDLGLTLDEVIDTLENPNSQADIESIIGKFIYKSLEASILMDKIN